MGKAWGNPRSPPFVRATAQRGVAPVPRQTQVVWLGKSSHAFLVLVPRAHLIIHTWNCASWLVPNMVVSFTNRIRDVGSP